MSRCPRQARSARARCPRSRSSRLADGRPKCSATRCARSASPCGAASKATDTPSSFPRYPSMTTDQINAKLGPLDARRGALTAQRTEKDAEVRRLRASLVELMTTGAPEETRAKIAARTDAIERESAALSEAIAKDRKSTRLNSSHPSISYAVFCLKKKK